MHSTIFQITTKRLNLDYGSDIDEEDRMERIASKTLPCLPCACNIQVPET